MLNKNYADWTRLKFATTLKLFLVVAVLGEGYSEAHNYTHLKVKWLNTKRPRNTLQQDKLLNKEDYTNLIKHCTNPRDKALISLLFEAGLKLGELTGLTIGSLRFDRKGCVLTVDSSGKTGTRQVRLITHHNYYSIT